MGFKLTGLAINKPYQKNLGALMDLLQIGKFVFNKESTFEEEALDILEDDFISVAFFETGTFLSTGITLMRNDPILTKASLNKKIITFYVNDTMSIYCFDFYENGAYVRKK